MAPVIGPVYPAAYSFPQHHQAQQLFQKDAQTIISEALATVKAAIVTSATEQKLEIKNNGIPRKAAGKTWEDPTLADWPENDFRLFCGDLGNEVDDVLSKAFSRYPSFNKARHGCLLDTCFVLYLLGVLFIQTGSSLISVTVSPNLAAAMKEMNGKYVGNRPIKLRKSTWKDRIDHEALEKQKNQVTKKPKVPKQGVILGGAPSSQCQTRLWKIDGGN